jgi:hypothetical protein
MTYPGKCPYCEKQMVKTGHSMVAVTNDHIVPLSAGGHNNDKNTIDVCLKCNYVKAHYLPYQKEWFKSPDRAEITHNVLKVIWERKIEYPWTANQIKRFSAMETDASKDKA